MEYRKTCPLARLYCGPEHPICEDYAELKLIRYAVQGDAGAAKKLFCETKLFGSQKSAIDTPYGRFEGISGVEAFVTGFLSTFRATSGEIVPVIQTRAGGRSVTELQINFVVDGMLEEVPMFVVADLRTADLLDEVRIYFHCSYIPGLQAYRKPMFQSAHLEMGDPAILTGAVREYYEALHCVPAVDVDRIMGCIGDVCAFGGYLPDTPSRKPALTREDIRAEYEYMKCYIPRCVAMRYETVIDDGKNGIIEWVHIISRAGREERHRIALSGIAAYERGADGKLCSIRISDYAGLEDTIDWSKLDISKEDAQNINFVEHFPSGVGRKNF